MVSVEAAVADMEVPVKGGQLEATVAAMDQAEEEEVVGEEETFITESVS